MIYLLLSILCSSLIFILFKWLGKLGMNTLLIIVINYCVAAIIGLILTGQQFMQLFHEAEWIPWAMLLGSAFVGMFYAMARATHLTGAAAAVVANKMSVVIPVVVAFAFLGDALHPFKLLGIFLALLGIYFVTRKKEKHVDWKAHFFLLIFVFLGSGLIDTSIKLIENFYLTSEDSLAFTAILFLTAFLVGTMILSVRLQKHLQTYTWSKLWMGIALGFVNFGSIYFLILALKSEGMESSVLFPLNNIGVVLLSAVGSVLLFREELTKKNLLGLFLSVLALIFLMLAS